MNALAAVSARQSFPPLDQPQERPLTRGSIVSRPEPDRLGWFVVCTENNEFSVEAALIDFGERAGLVIDAYCPARTVWHETQRERFRIQEPLYPGYLFVGLGATQRGAAGIEYPIGEVERVKGVDGILRGAGALIQVPYDPPDPEFLRFTGDAPDQAWSIFGLREQERLLAFDFTRGIAHSRRAAKAVKRARESFKGLANPAWAARWLALSGEVHPGKGEP